MRDRLDSHSRTPADRQRRYEAALVSEEIRRLARDSHPLVKPSRDRFGDRHSSSGQEQKVGDPDEMDSLHTAADPRP